MPKHYPFETIFNFRDFGGYATESGGRVVEGKLFRSANLSRLSDEDLSSIADMDIGLVVDLRYRPERERQPSRFWEGGPGALFEFTPVEGSVVHKVAPHEAFMKEGLQTANDARTHMLEGYRKRPHDPGFKAIARKTLHHMAETGDGVLVHCAAGKDRTGTLCALVLHILGVDADTIMEDFMATMSAVDVDALLDMALPVMSERYGRALDKEAVRPMFGVEEGYLRAALEAMGNVDGYLADTLGVGAREREALRARYLA